jgi:hypothetical protein
MRLTNLITAAFNVLMPLYFNVQISEPCTNGGMAKIFVEIVFDPQHTSNNIVKLMHTYGMANL